MKKLLAIMLCAVLIFALPIFASAEETDVYPLENEIATESKNSASEKTVTENIVDYVLENIDKLVVIVVMAGYSIAESFIRGKMKGSIGTLNNNAIAIANNSANAINNALDKVENIANKIKQYEEKFDSLIDEIRVSEEEKKALEDKLTKVESYLNTAKLANIEFANELAELLCLANIPNSKKDELYKKHVEGVQKLEGEVKSDAKGDE
jgi:ribosome-associated translation inhibitor RaiA